MNPFNIILFLASSSHSYVCVYFLGGYELVVGQDSENCEGLYCQEAGDFLLDM